MWPCVPCVALSTSQCGLRPHTLCGLPASHQSGRRREQGSFRCSLSPSSPSSPSHQAFSRKCCHSIPTQRLGRLGACSVRSANGWKIKLGASHLPQALYIDTEAHFLPSAFRSHHVSSEVVVLAGHFPTREIGGHCQTIRTKRRGALCKPTCRLKASESIPSHSPLAKITTHCAEHACKTQQSLMPGPRQGSRFHKVSELAQLMSCYLQDVLENVTYARAYNAEHQDDRLRVAASLETSCDMQKYAEVQGCLNPLSSCELVQSTR